MKPTKTPLQVFKGPKTTGALLKAFRESFEISQNELAAITGIPQANLSAIENDRRDVGPEVALKLAAAIGVAPDIILYPGGYETEPTFVEVQKRSAALGGRRK